MARLGTIKEFNQRLKDLGGILKKNSPNAQDIHSSGSIINYIAEQRARSIKRQNKKRERMRDKVSLAKYGVEFEYLTTQQQTNIITNNDLADIKGRYLGATGLNTLTAMEYSITGVAMAEQYISVIEDNMREWGDQGREVIEIIKRLALEGDELQAIFSLQASETQLYYIYPYSKDDPTPFDYTESDLKRDKKKSIESTRKYKVLQYWRNMAIDLGVMRRDVAPDGSESYVYIG